MSKLGEVALPALDGALHGHPSAEARRQVKGLPERLNAVVPHPEDLRQLRAVAALEHLGTREARGVLERLAKGEPAARLTAAARAALRRLEMRAVRP